VLPVVLLLLNFRSASIKNCWQGFQALSPAAAMLVCLTGPYLAIQTAAMMKNGGGAYDMDLAVLLALPLIMLAGKQCGLDKQTVCVLLACVATAGLAYSTAKALPVISQGSRLIEDSRSYLVRKYPQAVVLYSADQYCVIGNTSLRPATDVLSVWHYLTAGDHLERVTAALEAQEYDLLIYPGDFGNSAPFEAFDRLLREKYVPLVDDEIPLYLRGGLFIRRSR
jgi:hypothetical protein